VTHTRAIETADVIDDVVALRRRIHEQPELGLDLPLTQAAVLESLDDLGLTMTTGTTSSSIVADLDGSSEGATGGPTVLLRADMDALPLQEHSGEPFASRTAGHMHACGHDAHTAMLVGAARMLAARRDDLRGRVRFLFQPGEEGHAGARHAMADGALDGVDAAFALHVGPNLRSGRVAWRRGAILASADEFEVDVIGRGGHASSPHWAADPVPVACEIVLALQTMVTRTVDAFDPAVVGVSQVRAGTTHNVIPERASMLGTVRAVSEATRRSVLENITRVAEGVAAAHGCTAEVRRHEGYPVTVNNGRAAEFQADVARSVVGDRSVTELPSPLMGAEDFSYILEAVPGAMCFLGVCPPEIRNPLTAPSCHSDRMRLDEDALGVGVALHVATATAFLMRSGDLG
jgi:hippurate hydrolase